MRNYLKFLTTAIVASLLVCMLCFTSFAASTVFSDVDDSNESLSEAVNLLSNLGVTNGKTETTFGTYDNVTREQMAAFIYRLFKSGKTNEEVPNTTSFTDLEDATYFGYISWADAMGVIKGTSATTFNPKGGITLQDAYTMVVRALQQEEEDFQYPYSHIDAAESEALRLDKGLASTINYDTVLTRGDVAIILYNAFFAETGVEKTTSVERALGNGRVWVLEEKTYNPTLAEEVYNVEVGEYVVRATPKYAFNDSSEDDTYVPLTEGFGGDTLHVVAVDKDEPLGEFYLPYEDSGLRDAVDSYIMRTIKIYYTYEKDGDRNKLDKVYFAHGDYKVIESNSVTAHYTSVKNAEDRYTGTTNAKALGYLTVNKEKVYFFDAPYSYIKPNYNVVLNHVNEEDFSMEAARYYLRNEKNVKLINIKCVDIENGAYSYYIDEKQPAASTEDIIVTLRRIYSNGVYKTKFYDVDGDGVYEYLHYMPATYGFMNGDDHKEFTSKMTENAPVHEPNNGSEFDLPFTPTIFYNGAVVSGAAFNDGDFVVAHLNPQANMIEVMGVVKPYKGYASQIRTASCIVKVDGVNFTGAYSYRVVEGFSDGNTSTYDSYNSYANRFSAHSHTNSGNFPIIVNKKQLFVGEIVNIYAYKIFGQTNILYYDHLEDAALTFGKDELLIPVSDEDDANLTKTKNQFDPEIGDTVYYLEAYTGADKTRYVPLCVKDMYPVLDGEYSDGNYNIGNTMSTVDPAVRAYVDKICKFTVDSDGLYTLVPLLHATDSDGEYSGINRDSSVLKEDKGNKQFGNDFGYSVYGKIVKVAGNRYKLLDTADDQTLLGDPFSANGNTINYFNITGATRIIIKNKTYDGTDVKVEYLEYDASNFGGTTESELTNIQYILKTVPGTTGRADLVLFYAEADDFEFENKIDKTGWRIVASSDLEETEDGKYNNFYTLLNPFTGEVETNVASADTSKTKPASVAAPANVGDIVEVRQGRVNEDKYLGNFDLEDIGGGLVWITEFDEKDSFFTAVPVEATALEMDGGSIDCEECFGEFIEGYTYNDAEKNFTGEKFVTAEDNSPLYYEITDDTVITVLKYKNNDLTAFEKGEFVLSDASAIADPKSEYKCYNDNVEDKNGNFGKKYAKYLKAYVYVAKEPIEREIPKATFIVIVATGEENAIFTDHDSSFLDKNCPNP